MTKSHILILIALAVRFQNVHHFAKWQIVAIELALIGAYIFLNRKKLPDLFLKVRNFKWELCVGTVVSLAWVVAEISYDRFMGVTLGSPYWRSIFLLPVVILIAGWASALYEELLFRSILFSEILHRSRRPILAILVQGLVFGLAHWTRYFHDGQWFHALTTTVLGIFLGTLTWRTRSLLPAWIVHVVSNSYGIVFMQPDTIIPRVVESWLH